MSIDSSNPTTTEKTTGRIRLKNQEAILAAAAEEFACHGYKGTSMNSIALRVGLPKANLHYYFSSKQGLYVEVMRNILELWDSAFSNLRAEDDPASALANYIRGLGWAAEARTGPMSGDMTMIPAAIEAGMGQLGKHGSIINDTWGASFRLSAVTTDLPLLSDAPRDIGVDDFCTRCQVCSSLCPPDAIFADKQTVRGELKWYVDFDKCIPYFNDTLGCGICIAECPWSLPGVAPKLTQKMLRRRSR